MKSEFYTSSALAQKFKESGCEIATKKVIVRDNEDRRVFVDNVDAWKLEIEQNGYGNKDVLMTIYPAYHILEDVCVKYAKEFFGDHYIWDLKLKMTYYAEQITQYMQLGKKQEAEDYIWDHCLFNSKNK